MKKLKKLIAAIVASLTFAIATVLLAGCQYGDKYDNDEWIAKTVKSYSVMMFTIQKTTNGFEASAQKFSGLDVISDKIKVTDGTIYIGYDCTVTSGRFKLVAVCDDRVYTICEGTTSADPQNVELPNGNYRLKIVGDEAEFKLQVTLS